MKLTRCDNGHFYDGDKYAQCPHCGKLEPIAVSIPVVQSPIQHSVKSTKKSVQVVPVYDDDDDETILIDEDEEQTVLMTSEIENQHSRNPVVSRSTVTEGGKITTSRTSETSSMVMNTEKQTDMASPIVQSVSLQAAVGQARGQVSTEDTKTVAFYDFAETEPVVGWLVCVRGEYKGESFPLKAGRNLIGRSLKMDVPLAKELSVSRDKHAVVIYEPKKRVFYIHAGDGNGLTYVNDDLLMMPMQITDFDQIQLGNGIFLLRTFCCDRFSWDDFA